MQPNEGREGHWTRAVNENDAAKGVESALAYIEETEARLLRTEDRMRALGMPEQVRQYARARAELMPVRAILRGNNQE
jgi:hypothetical protein